MSDSATPLTVAHQAPLSKGFSRQEYWSGLPFSSPGDLPNPGVKPRSPVLQSDSLPTELSGQRTQVGWKHSLPYREQTHPWRVTGSAIVPNMLMERKRAGIRGLSVGQPILPSPASLKWSYATLIKGQWVFCFLALECALKLQLPKLTGWPKFHWTLTT